MSDPHAADRAAPGCPHLPDCEVSEEPVDMYRLGPDVTARVCLTHESHNTEESE